MINTKETKKEIRAWQKLKKKARKGTEQRREYNRKIRELKKRLEANTVITPKKKELIKEMKALYPGYILRLNIDYMKFTEAELEKHLYLLKEKIRRGIRI